MNLPGMWDSSDDGPQFTFINTLAAAEGIWNCRKALSRSVPCQNRRLGWPYRPSITEQTTAPPIPLAKRGFTPCWANSLTAFGLCEYNKAPSGPNFCRGSNIYCFLFKIPIQSVYCCLKKGNLSERWQINIEIHFQKMVHLSLKGDIVGLHKLGDHKIIKRKNGK